MFAKLLYSIVSVVLVSSVLDHFYQKYFAKKHFLRIEFDHNCDQNWVTDLREYILAYMPEWGNDSFTPNVGRCVSHCYHENSVDNIYYDHACESRPVFLNDDRVTQEKLSRMTYAEATIPCFLYLTQSKIPDANRGIFTKVRLPKGALFGPYEGFIRSAYGDEGDEARNGGYAWRVNREDENGEEDDFYIDGVEETNSNWLRYVNAARYEEEQNLYVLIFNETVYYIAYKDVEPGSELLVWYGRAYANWLGIDVVEGADHDWTTDFAPKKSIVICNSCERTQAMIDAMKAADQQNGTADSSTDNNNNTNDDSDSNDLKHNAADHDGQVVDRKVEDHATAHLEEHVDGDMKTADNDNMISL